MKLISENPYITKNQIVEQSGKSLSTVERRMRKLKDNYIARKGPDKGGFGEVIKDF